MINLTSQNQVLYNDWGNVIEPSLKLQAFDQLVEENRQLRLLVNALWQEKLKLEQTLHSEGGKGNINPPMTYPSFDLQTRMSLDGCKIEGDSRPCSDGTSASLEVKEEALEMSGTPNIIIKCEEDDILSSDEDSDDMDWHPKIRRRKEFKQKGGSKRKKTTEKNFTKRSKAKHLWIAYGRKILDYALKNSDGDIKDKIKDHEQDLMSKRGFARTFKLKKDDSADEVQFKKFFGEMALNFVNNQIDDAFLSSNYSKELLDQKGIVAKWIQNQINGN